MNSPCIYCFSLKCTSRVSLAQKARDKRARLKTVGFFTVVTVVASGDEFVIPRVVSKKMMTLVRWHVFVHTVVVECISGSAKGRLKCIRF